ncbi:MAG: glycoside hydrolase family 19 protein [Blastocatellia bacterium]
MSISQEQLKRIAVNLPTTLCGLYAPLLATAMNEFEIDTPRRGAAFLAHTCHESQEYQRLVENMNYSAQRLMAVWPKRFPSLSYAQAYDHQPEKIANYVYANRNGNGSPESGDGWRYRGRAIIGITGKANYEPCGVGIGLDLVSHPELLEQPVHAIRAGAWWWSEHGLNALADASEFEEQTKVINGGLNGLAERKIYWARAKQVLG